MKIPHPKLNFANSKRAIQQYAEWYNGTVNNDEKLKSIHFQQLYTYVRLYNRMIKERVNTAFNNGNYAYMLLDTDQMPALFTNNKEISKQMDGGHPSTILRRFHRLEKAGLVRKVNHGPVRNYEIIINPFILFISDEDGSGNVMRPDFENAKKWATTWDSQNSINANCTPYTVSFKEHLNKKIITQKESGKPDIPSIETSKDTPQKESGKPDNLKMETSMETLKDTPESKETKTKNSGENHTENKNFGLLILQNIKMRLEAKEQAEQKEENTLPYAERMRLYSEKLKKFKKQYATMLVALMIDYLLKDKTVYDGERLRTIEYVEKHYFDHCLNFSQLERVFANYAERLEDARKFKVLHPDYTPFPYYYFRKDNPVGFDSPKWNHNRNLWKKRNRYRNERQKLMQAIKRLNEKPTEQTMQKELQYVKSNIPNMLPAFFAIIYKNENVNLNLKRS